jgi:hypothetical protein
VSYFALKVEGVLLSSQTAGAPGWAPYRSGSWHVRDEFEVRVLSLAMA